MPINSIAYTPPEDGLLRPSGDLLDILLHPQEQTVRERRGNNLREYMKTLETTGFSSFQKDVLIGTLLGDGTLAQIKPSFTPFFKYDQGRMNSTLSPHLDNVVDANTVHLVYSIFEPFVGTPPRLRTLNGKSHSMWFRTFSSRLLIHYANLFYTRDGNGRRRKRVPPNIQQLLNERSLAFWIADDGSNQGRGLTLHTEGFTESDVTLLEETLVRTWGFSARKHKAGEAFKLFLPNSDMPRVREIVAPHTPPIKRYKLLA